MKKLQSDSSSPLYHQLMQRLSEDIEKANIRLAREFPLSMNWKRFTR